MVDMTPEKAKQYLTGDQYKLYKLIWERYVASLMSSALLDTVAVDIAASEYTFKASGHTVKFDGFTVLYEEKSDVAQEETGALPPLEEEAKLVVKELSKNQHFTEPPPRFTEASLIKALEENGIGRPSTYAPTITTILSRCYVERDGKMLKPTPLGDTITILLKEMFARIVDAEFTANMEKNLDLVETDEKDWVGTLSDFWTDFNRTLEDAEKQMEGKRVKIPDEPTDIPCDLCGKTMVIKTGRFGKFLACPGFPECKNTKKIVQETGGFCPKCGSRILSKKSQKGKVYFGCEHNPKCDFMSWDTPIPDLCPSCGKTMFRKGKNGKPYCISEECKK
jgi:DNA topoisomerase-1